MIKKMWKIKLEEPYIEPTKEMKSKLKCIFCGENLVLRRVGVPIQRESGGYAIDINYKCPKCDWFVTFGVSLSPELAEKLKKEMNNQQYIPQEEWLQTEKVKERLESWGYW